MPPNDQRIKREDFLSGGPSVLGEYEHPVDLLAAGARPARQSEAARLHHEELLGGIADLALLGAEPPRQAGPAVHDRVLGLDGGGELPGEVNHEFLHGPRAMAKRAGSALRRTSFAVGHVASSQ